MTKVITTLVAIGVALLVVRTEANLAIEAGKKNVLEPAAGIANRQVLYLTHSAGFKHEVLPLSERILKRIGEQSGAFEVSATQDCSAISRDGLKPFDAVVFYTTGELPISDAQKDAF